jgi:hypothetical protein
MLTLLRFLVVLLVQGATALLVITALRSDQWEVRLLLGGLAVTVGVLAAAGLAALSRAASQQALARAREGFSREREALRVKAERDRSRMAQEGYRRAQRERVRLQGRSGLRLGVSAAGVIGLGVVLLFSQMVSLGVLALTAGGAAVGGYLLRARQDGRGLDGPWLTALAARLRLRGGLRPPGTGLVPTEKE